MNGVRSFVSKVVLLGGFLAVWWTPGLTQAQAVPLSNAAISLPVDNFSAVVEDCTVGTFFGLRPWYYYLGKELDTGRKADNTLGENNGDNGNVRKCDIKCFNLTDQGSKPNECGQTKSDVPLVLLAVIDDLLRLAGIMGVCFVMWGAVRYVASQGNPEQTSKAQGTIINAVAGVALAGVSIAFVSYLGNTLGG